MKNGCAHMGCDPQRQPVVAEIEYCISPISLLQGLAPQRWHQAMAGDHHPRISLSVLPTGLITTGSGEQLHRLTTRRKTGTLSGHQPESMAPLRQAPQQGCERQLNPPATATAEGADGCADEDEIQRS